MRITFTVDSVLREKLDGVTGRPLFWDTYRLIKKFARRGYDVRVVQTDDAVLGQGFTREFYIPPSGTEESQKFTLPDVFFIRSYGLRVDKMCFDNFVDTVRTIEGDIPLVINSGEATSFSRKDKQKKLPLPFIPYYRIKRISDVERLLDENREGLILKPDCGLQAEGVEYIQSMSDLETLLKRRKVSEESLVNSNTFEKFIRDKKEIRYIFLYKKMIGSRIAIKEGEPGRESLGTRFLNENPNEKHLEIAEKAMALTGIDFGCVDFRGDYVLEINGSGTQTFYREKVGGGKTFLDVTATLLDEVERRYNRTK